MGIVILWENGTKTDFCELTKHNYTSLADNETTGF
jgi:hypothetical protein